MALDLVPVKIKLDLRPITPKEKPVVKLDLTPITKTIPREAVGRSMLPTTPFTPEEPGLAWTPPGKLDLKPISRESFYPKFVETLKRTQAGARGVVSETIESLQDPSKSYEPIKRFKEALKGNEYTTAHDVFKSLDPQSKSTVLNIIQGTGQATAEVALDFLTDPTVYLMWGGGKTLRGIYELGKKMGVGKPLGNLVAKMKETPAGKKAVEWLVYRGNQPNEYQKAAEVRLDNIARGHKVAENIGAKLSRGFNRAEQQRIGQILRGSVSGGEAERPLRRVAAKARLQLTKVGKQAVEQNLLSEEKFAANMQTYMPRLYRKWELEGAGKGIADFFHAKPIRIKGQRFLRRQDIPPQIRAAMGEIKEPAYPVTKGIAQITNDVETSKLFNAVARNPEWTSDVLKPGFVEVTGSAKRLGALSGKYVSEPIAKDINEITRSKGAIEKIYNSFLGYWKFSKTVANPATHFRNVFSNSILLDLSGVDHLAQTTLIPKAGKEILSKGKYYREIKDRLGKEFVGGEVRAFLDGYSGDTLLDKLANVIKPVRWAGKKAGNLYQAEEQIFKMAKYMSVREKGLDVNAAWKEAEKWLFNYEKVPKAISYLRRSPVGAPFITFASKALPRVAETAITSPLQVGKYSIMMKAIENLSKERLNMSEDEYRAIKKNRRGINLILPIRDNAGLVQTLDVSYILPWGDIGETGGVFGLSPSISPSNPLPKTIAELAFNKSLFTGREIFKETDSGIERAQKMGDHLAKNLVPLPTWMPPGYSWTKLTTAIAKKPDYYGRVRGLPKVLADIVLGIKVSPVDVGQVFGQEDNRRKFEESELKRDLTYTLKHPGINPDEKKKKARVYGEKIRRLHEDKLELNEFFRLLVGGGI